MAWECGDCSRPDGPELRVRWVCHHCGKLLCEDHMYALRDDGFRGALTLRAPIALHCHDCRDAHHSIIRGRPAP